MLSAAADTESSGEDELLPAAVDVVLETGQASVSMLQRRLKLGYSRAARLVDQMEERGIVGPFEGSKPRQLLITRAQWDEHADGALRQLRMRRRLTQAMNNKGGGNSRRLLFKN